MTNTNFTCRSCGREWPENYCPECAKTIDRGPAPPLLTRIKRLRFKANKKLWILFSIPPFVLCWLYPCLYDKGGSPLLGRLWVDVLHGRQDFGLWVGLAMLAVVFGTFAALVGYAAQAFVVVLRSRRKGAFHEAA
jgi:hypothetical protein